MVKVDRTCLMGQYIFMCTDMILFYFILFYKLCHNISYIIHITLLTITQKIRAVARALIGGGGGGGIFIYSCYARRISFEISCF